MMATILAYMSSRTVLYDILTQINACIYSKFTEKRVLGVIYIHIQSKNIWYLTSSYMNRAENEEKKSGEALNIVLCI